jgi:hypothetical protein
MAIGTCGCSRSLNIIICAAWTILSSQLVHASVYRMSDCAYNGSCILVEDAVTVPTSYAAYHLVSQLMTQMRVGKELHYHYFLGDAGLNERRMWLIMCTT